MYKQLRDRATHNEGAHIKNPNEQCPCSLDSAWMAYPNRHSRDLVLLQAHFQPHSWVSALAAPRETVVQQLWRQDEHGVYLVMVHSTDHAAAPETEHPWWHWYSPVRSQVHLSSIALSPHFIHMYGNLVPSANLLLPVCKSLRNHSAFAMLGCAETCMET